MHVTSSQNLSKLFFWRVRVEVHAQGLSVYVQMSYISGFTAMKSVEIGNISHRDSLVMGSDGEDINPDWE